MYPPQNSMAAPPGAARKWDKERLFRDRLHQVAKVATKSKLDEVARMAVEDDKVVS